MKPYYLLIFVILTNISEIFPQTNQEKYWFYRKRLTDYFVLVGNNPGNSFPISERNVWRSNKCKFGDGTIELAWYISALASE
jgi:hypothetical protein